MMPKSYEAFTVTLAALPKPPTDWPVDNEFGCFHAMNQACPCRFCPNVFNNLSG
jgi:hypothetical protein